MSLVGDRTPARNGNILRATSSRGGFSPSDIFSRLAEVSGSELLNGVSFVISVSCESRERLPWNAMRRQKVRYQLEESVIQNQKLNFLRRRDHCSLSSSEYNSRSASTRQCLSYLSHLSGITAFSRMLWISAVNLLASGIRRVL